MLDALPKTRAVLERGRADGLHHGAQLFVSLRGEAICDAAVGEVRPGEPLTADHLMLWLSAGKPVTAAAVVLHCSRAGGSELDDRVADYLPDFNRGGKGGVTVRHLLTHTAGFPDADPDYPMVGWDESIRRLCHACSVKDWVVGETAGYHPKSSWFILGELLRRWEDESAMNAPDKLAPFDEVVAVQPALSGFRGWWSVGKHRLAEVRPRLVPMFKRRGRELIDAGMTTDHHLTNPSPGSSLRCRAADLGGFYEDLLDSLTGRGLGELPPAAVHLMIQRHREDQWDRTFQSTVDFGLGVIVDSNRYGPDTVPYGFGPHCSPRTFGHGGNQSSMAFCDPENELVVAWATNGMCGEPKHQKRNRAINAAIYEDLGLAG